MKFSFLSKHAGFVPAKLKMSTSLIPNPGRGWYQIIYFHIPQKPIFQELRWCLRDNETIAMAVVNIGAYRSKAFDQDALDIITSILEFYKQHEKDLILRFTYDCEGKGLLCEPALFSQIEEHILQLSPLIRSYTKTIFILQGLFVGNWGEMHGSKFLSSSHLKRLNALVEAAAGENTWLAVRKPCQWRVIHSPEEVSGRMGLFDDGILGSDTNLGTFGYLKRSESRWEDPWAPHDELAFEDQLCAATPHGGEVIASQQMHTVSPDKVLHFLQKMHISYLNCVHDPKVFDIWKQTDSPWSGISLYDYVGAHLGYRFCIESVKVRIKNHQKCLKIALKNTGFAPCYEDYILKLEIVSEDALLQFETMWDLRTVEAGSVKHWEFILPKNNGNLFLSAQRKKDGRRLLFAHDEHTQGKLFLGRLI